MKTDVGQSEVSNAAAETKPATEEDYRTLPLAELQGQLGSTERGLTQAEAAKRLARYGPNEIAEKKPNELLKFLSYFWGPIPWMIEVAVILSAVDQRWPDFAIILVLLFANAGVGFWEEHQAGSAIAALKARLAIQAKVVRDGKWSAVAARELVPGYVIRIAVVTDIEWIRHTVWLFSFLIPGTVRLYPLSEAGKARAWIVAAS